MDEAKSLVHHALSALFASLILAAVMSLITLGNMMWRAFADQAEANRRLEEYAKYAAFDNQDVRGQDVISLIHDTQGTPFIIIVGKQNKTTPNYIPLAAVFNPVDLSFNVKESSIKSISEVGEALSPNTNTLLDFVNRVGTYNENVTQGTVKDENGNVLNSFYFNCSASTPISYVDIQSWFLKRGEAIGNAAGYLKYNSQLIYEDDSSTDIVGICLIEEEGGTN